MDKIKLSDAEIRLQIDKAVAEDMRRLRERYSDIAPLEKPVCFLIKVYFGLVGVTIIILLLLSWWLK